MSFLLKEKGLFVSPWSLLRAHFLSLSSKKDARLKVSCGPADVSVASLEDQGKLGCTRLPEGMDEKEGPCVSQVISERRQEGGSIKKIPKMSRSISILGYTINLKRFLQTVGRECY